MKLAIGILSLVVLLSGCTMSNLWEKRGFSYKRGTFEFECNHTPKNTTVNIDKEVLSGLTSSETPFMLVSTNAGADQATPQSNPPEAKDLIRYCQQLIAGEHID